MRKLKRSERPEGFDHVPKSAIFIEISVDEMGEILGPYAVQKAGVPMRRWQQGQLAVTVDYATRSIVNGFVIVWGRKSK